MAGKEDWADLKTIIQYRCWRTIDGEQTMIDRYYISNADMDAQEWWTCPR
ncbi:MAG: hypothetical protein LBK62_12015 [Treponema sp.]|jgi:hypothetical protein|nr:hypothetical protein [Treponema sp.]